MPRISTARKFRLAMIAIAALTSSMAAHAVPITYNVTLTPGINLGSFSSATGSFTIQSATAVPNAYFSAGGGSPTLTAFNFLLNGHSFGINSSAGVQFSNGVLTQLNYNGAASDAVGGLPTLSLYSTTFNYVESYAGNLYPPNVGGTFSATVATTTTTRVPEPGTLALLGLGLVGLGFGCRKRAA